MRELLTLMAGAVVGSVVTTFIAVCPPAPAAEYESAIYKRVRSSDFGGCKHSARFAEACMACKAYDGDAFWDCRLNKIMEGNK